MREFAALYAELDETTSTTRKLAALQRYFASADPANAAWAVFFLAGGKPRQAVPRVLLRQYAIEYAGLSEWLFDESYHAVGDFAETIAHILPAPSRQSDIGLAVWMRERILALRGSAPEVIRAALFQYWDELQWRERFLLHKLIGGSLRVGVSRLLVTRALAAMTGLDSKLIAQRLVGWTGGAIVPSAADYALLLAPQTDAEHRLGGGQPYPFFLAHPLLSAPEQLGSVEDWLVEWKYDGIRAQLVRRGGQNYLWSRGEELVTERFPELAQVVLPEGTVLDGEILVWQSDAAMPSSFALLQKRIGRKRLTRQLLAELPVVLCCYDLLELDGSDMRNRPQIERRQQLEQLLGRVTAPQLRLSPLLAEQSWEALALARSGSRARSVEGLMLKAKSAHYGVGRTKDVGVWWKWKIDPYSVDAVLLYAQPGTGRRASLYTDYTFAVWSEEGGQRRLVPFAKAYSGLSDAEIAQVDQVIRRTTVEKFGPVRALEPTMVFEIGFEGIARSPRHKAGIAVRFPRILRQRPDKPVAEADTLATLEQLVAAEQS